MIVGIWTLYSWDMIGFVVFFDWFFGSYGAQSEQCPIQSQAVCEYIQNGGRKTKLSAVDQLL